MKMQIVAVFANMTHGDLARIAELSVDRDPEFDNIEDEARQEEINRVMDILIEVAGL